VLHTAPACIPPERGGGNGMMGAMGEPPFSSRNEVWRVYLGAHPKLGALVGALLELRFFEWRPYSAMGAQVEALLKLLLKHMSQIPETQHHRRSRPTSAGSSVQWWSGSLSWFLQLATTFSWWRRGGGGLSREQYVRVWVDRWAHFFTHVPCTPAQVRGDGWGMSYTGVGWTGTAMGLPDKLHRNQMSWYWSFRIHMHASEESRTVQHHLEPFFCHKTNHI
jgi:hypothetical protein